MPDKAELMMYEAEAKAVAGRVAAVRRPDSLVFPIFTDTHLHTLEEPAAEQMIAAMRALSGELTADAVLALGDNLAMLGREEHASNEKIAALIRGLMDRVGFVWPCPIFAINGNHDGVGTDFFKADFWRAIIGDSDDGGLAVRENNSPWFTVDYADRKLRMVFLSLPSGSDLDAENPTPLWAFGAQQLRWLANTALDTTFQVLLVCHVPLYYDYQGDREMKLGVWNGTKAAESYVSALCGWIDDRAEAEEILNAFHEHRPCRIPTLGIDRPASAGTCGLVACLSGHMHSDSVWQPGEEKKGCRNGLPCPQVVTGASNIRINGALRDTARMIPCLDIAVVTLSERRLDTVRFGAGSDRTNHW